MRTMEPHHNRESIADRGVDRDEYLDESIPISTENIISFNGAVSTFPNRQSSDVPAVTEL